MRKYESSLARYRKAVVADEPCPGNTAAGRRMTRAAAAAGEVDGNEEDVVEKPMVVERYFGVSADVVVGGAAGDCYANPDRPGLGSNS